MAQVGSIHPGSFTNFPAGTSVYEKRCEIQSFMVQGDVNIVAGDWVELDVSQSGSEISNSVVPAEAIATDGNALVIGVALDSTVEADDGYAQDFSMIRVCTSGYCASAKVTASIAAGLDLFVADTAATAELFTAAALTRAVGVTLAADSGATGFAPVWVYKA